MLQHRWLLITGCICSTINNESNIAHGKLTLDVNHMFRPLANPPEEEKKEDHIIYNEN